MLVNLCSEAFYYFPIALGAFYLSKGLIKGAEKAGNIINNKTPEIINRMTPASQAAYINPKIAKGMKIAGSATSGAVHVTGFVGTSIITILPC